MDIDALGTDRDVVAWWLRQPAIPDARLAARRPDFLVISPAKTGSTWLADNLRRHPDLFVPAIKEVKYFSSWFKWFDLDWYLHHFADGEGRLKGEASPSYAVLPVRRIRLIRGLMPNVKLVFLMRDPVGRAWSHARHNCVYRETNFADSAVGFEEVSEQQWAESFAHDWPLAAGDYLGQLRRWLSVFPREQVYVGFYESIVREPETLLREVFAFLGARPDVDLSGFPVRERILAGRPGELTPALRGHLHRLLHARSAELATFLRDHLGLTPPPEWQPTLAPPDSPVAVPAAFTRELDDDHLARVVAEEETFPSASRPILDAYRGFNVAFHRGLLYALCESLGRIDPADLPEARRRRHQAERRCFVAATLSAVKEQVDQHVFERGRAEARELPVLRAELRTAQERISGLEHELRVAVEAVRKVEADLVWLRPWALFVGRVLRPAWRRLRSRGL
jgi:hypothetical protein